jgi:hypothetical protein
VIQTALDFGARFPWHKAADANPLPGFRQTALTARILTKIKSQGAGIYGWWLFLWQGPIGQFPMMEESQNRKA